MREPAASDDGRGSDRANRASTYRLIFDRRVPYGSAEHFFHFMWGYLLPSVHTIHASADPATSQFVFRSCGPVMDALTREVASLFGYQSRLVPEADFERPDGGFDVPVPRWDIGVLRPYLLGHGRKSQHAMRMLAELDQHDTRRQALHRDNFLSELAEAIVRVKSLFFERLDEIDERSDSTLHDSCYLLLERSPRPDFYAKGGPAETHGYGTSRRALLGLDEAERILREENVPVRVYEPGRFSLLEQIRVFRRCRGIVGVKGAEFANMIWLAPKSRVLMIKPASMDTLPVQRCLADLLGLDYTEIEVDQRRKIPFDPDMVRDYLS